MKSAVKFEHVLKDHLSDPDQAAKYLTACYEEGSDVFLQALRDVVEAQGGMTRAARLAGLNRESLYRQLPRRSNPSLASLNTVLSALGLKLRFAVGCSRRAADLSLRAGGPRQLRLEARATLSPALPRGCQAWSPFIEGCGAGAFTTGTDQQTRGSAATGSAHD